MLEKDNLLNTADKDLICEYIYLSYGRVFNNVQTRWKKAVPQGVSVFRVHSDTRDFEYLFTKDDKYPVTKDNYDEVLDHLNKYADTHSDGLVFYLHSCMLPVASKHKKFSY